MKRFWTNTSVDSDNGLYTIRLDGRPVKMPSGASLAVPYAPLAMAIAAEWANAGETFLPDDVPLTRLASTALERIAAHRNNIITQLAAYGMNDLLCYRAASPEALISRQCAEWDPWLRWAEEIHGIDLLTTQGSMPVNQLPWTLEKLMNILTTRGDYALAALGVIIPALGSFVLGLALAGGALAADAACATAQLDELWQEEQWGTDVEARARRAHVSEDVQVSARFMALCAA